MISLRSFQILEFLFSFYSIAFSFLCYYCSINLERQLEHPGLRPDTSSLVLHMAIYLLKRSCLRDHIFFISIA